MKKWFVSTLFLFVFLWQASSNCLAQKSPDEGFITTPDGVRLFYKVVGSGAETLVAVHGGPGNSLTSILPDLEPLAKNRRVIYYDQRGNGRSDLMDEDDKKLSITKHVQDLEAVRVHFKLDKMTLLGNSWGGILIGYYAAAHPDRVERLVFHSPGSPTKALLSEMDAEVQRRLKRHYTDEQLKRLAVIARWDYWLKASDPRAVCNEMYRMILSVYGFNLESIKVIKGDVCSGPIESVRRQRFVTAQIWQELGNYNLLPSLGVVKAPALVIHGTADVIPVKSSEAWARALPNARLFLIERSGHMPQFEQPEIFFKAVETFLKGDFPTEAKKFQTSKG
ncbi:MAG TPA: alpha/beta hydrolase [Pyrinomonadaceae bacterium]|nr:alpha/beta hydrolase [Pyrinomonadaceae bacterium]